MPPDMPMGMPPMTRGPMPMPGMPPPGASADGGMGPQGPNLPAAPPMPPMPAPKLHDVTIVRRRDYGCARIAPVPPEEFGISKRQRSISMRDCDYCFHEVTRTESELIEMGFDEDQVKELPDGDTDDTEEAVTRDTVSETMDEGPATLNKANRRIKVTEHYCKLSYEDDEPARLYRITTAGESDEVLKRDGKKDVIPIDFVPFAAITPVIMTHRFFGRSVADLVMDIQRIKTALLRQMLDNVYLANNQRTEVAETHASKNTIEDLLSNRPGGIVRTKQPGGLIPIPNQEIGSFTFPMIEYMDATREWRTGVTRQGQGIEADALQNQTAAAVNKVYSAAQARMRLIARIFAETGIKDLFWVLHGTIRKNAKKSETVRLRNKWVPVDPRQWQTRDDMTANVGLGQGSREQQLAFMMALIGVQKEALMQPGLKLTDPQHVYNALKKITELGGEKNPEKYWTDPAERAQEPTPPDPKQAQAEAEIKLEQEKAKATLQLEQGKSQAQLQLDQARSQQEAQQAQMRNAADIQLAREKMQAEMQLKREQIGAELEMKRQQLQMEMTIKRELGLRGLQSEASQVNVGGEPG